MSAKDIWYGVLEAGEKTSPVVRDLSLEASQGKIYLFNHARNQFIEYAQTIVEPKLRELATDDISRNELDKAFKAARQAFSSTRKVHTVTKSKTAAPPVKKMEDDTDDFDVEIDDEMEEFIDSDD